ncbi:hypothetical protein H072_6718 [Dactylellina haptotyla CBS 200.50]|uniref:F-box domain-containing protein n=1 Tax=Dactylellina haptotyla (strain CBS 200.50) TaxID=1284197 RepID=S8AEE2_DACHA|nr:hypothetical protein H072_6718 [Dactylellina haptotyla CBS 200.50]
MSKLEDLPFDIKILLLQSLPDWETLLNFIVASRIFNTIWREHNGAISKYVMFNEASQFKEEAFLIACMHDKLTNEVWTRTELDKMYNIYADSLQEASELEPWYYSRVLQGGRDICMKVAASHEAILEHCRHIIKKYMLPRMRIWDSAKQTEAVEDPPLATKSEEDRIIRGLYRIWLILKLYCVRIADEDTRNVLEPEIMEKNRKDIIRYLQLWDFWEVKALQMMLPVFWNETKHVLDTKGFFTAGRGLCKCPGEFCAKYFTLFMTTLLLFRYPNNSIEWVARTIQKDDVQSKFQEICDILADAPTRKRLEMCKDFTGIAYNYFNLFYGFGRDAAPGPEAYSTVVPKRVCRPGTENYVRHGAQGREIWIKTLNHSGIRASDFQACLWDDWRLESWDYCFPIFEDSETPAVTATAVASSPADSPEANNDTNIE